MAENGAMISDVADAIGVPVSAEAVLGSLDMSSVVSFVRRPLFIEAANGVWTLAALSALGAALAGRQTYIIGRPAIEIAKNKGRCLTILKSARVIADCKSTHGTFVKTWSGRAIPNPRRAGVPFLFKRARRPASAPRPQLSSRHSSWRRSSPF